jgi:amidohydrolase
MRAIPQKTDFPSDLELLEWMRAIRRTLHRNPELSYQEHFTSALIREKLEELGVAQIKKVAGTGIIATLGSVESGPGHVALRADMDGLPLQDRKTVEYHSRIPQVMHACGHDGHVAMLLGAISILQGVELAGRVSCIFQPAEEHGNGAQRVIDEGGLDESVEAIFAGHIDTHYPTGVITVDEGVICSFADPFSVTVKGHGGHAARPHESRDALVAGAYLVTGLQTLVSRQTDPNEAGVVTVGRFASGHAHNIIPGEAQIDGTIRSTAQQVRNNLLAGLDRVAKGIGVQFQVEVGIRFHDSLPAVINSEKACAVARKAALEVVGRDQVCSQKKPSLGGEDFSFYQQVIDGCLVRFGADSKVPDCLAHSATFDFDENVLSVGSAWLARVALLWLAGHGGDPHLAE